MNTSNPNAGIGAPDAILYAIQEYNELPVHVRNELPLLYFLLGPMGTAPYKFSKEQASYIQPSPFGQTCGNCARAYKQVIHDRFICSQMAGDISPSAWCRLWSSFGT